MSTSSEMKDFRRELVKKGFVVSKTSGGHWRISHSNMEGPVFASDTPSDRRALKNLMTMLRRKMQPANDQ
jgi:predicted RNA binding protein YcfA (HicA-like mRNA interferase family)